MTNTMSSPRKIIIDVDTGVDDAQAIMMAVSNPDVLEVLAITCVQGNIDLDNVCRNTLRVLSACDRLDVPVFRGCSTHLIGHDRMETRYHGKDGMGNAANQESVDTGLIQSEHAALALIRLVSQFPGEITLVAVAPLTNVALAQRIDPEFGKKLKDVVIMGGNIHGIGNDHSPAAEFNFRCDPEAAYVVLRELGCPILIIPWETCINQGQPWEWFETWVVTDTKKGRFMHGILQHSVNILKTVTKRGYYTSCDLLAMAIVIDKGVAVEQTTFYAEVELTGKLTRGQMVCDRKGVLGKPCNVTVVLYVDLEKARNLYEKMLK